MPQSKRNSAKIVRNLFKLGFSSYFVSVWIQKALQPQRFLIRGNVMNVHFGDVFFYGLFALTGVFSGFLSGLLSIGGAFVMVPAFLAIFGYYFHFESHFLLQLSLGTTMACMIVTAVSATSEQSKRGSVYWEFIRSNWIPISIGTILGVILTNYFSTSLIKICFASFCIYSGFKMLTRSKLANVIVPVTDSVKDVAANVVSRARRTTFLFGTLCGFIGVGGANLFVPYLMKKEGVELKKAMGTASAAQVPIAVIGSVSYLILGLYATDAAVNSTQNTVGYIYLPALLLVSFVGLFFNKLGVAAAHKLPVPQLKAVFGLFTFLVGLRMMFSV
jgi:uncharacterized protein